MLKSLSNHDLPAARAYEAGQLHAAGEYDLESAVRQAKRPDLRGAVTAASAWIAAIWKARPSGTAENSVHPSKVAFGASK